MVTTQRMTWWEQSVSAARTWAWTQITPEAARIGKLQIGKEFCKATHMGFKEVLGIST